MARFLTTHQIANLLGVSERTVANWIDRGHLEAFRTPGGHRRVAPPALRDFLHRKKMPVPEELSEEIRVLIVEDDPLIAETLKTALLAEGDKYSVTTIGDGVSALIHIGSTRPHVVMLDILMPGMDGLEVCRKIRANDECRDVQVIFVTAYREMPIETIMRDTGAAAVLTKPVRGQDLREAVDNLVRARTRS